MNFQPHAKPFILLALVAVPIGCNRQEGTPTKGKEPESSNWAPNAALLAELGRGDCGRGLFRATAERLHQQRSRSRSSRRQNGWLGREAKVGRHVADGHDYGHESARQ